MAATSIMATATIPVTAITIITAIVVDTKATAHPENTQTVTTMTVHPGTTAITPAIARQETLEIPIPHAHPEDSEITVQPVPTENFPAQLISITAM